MSGADRKARAALPHHAEDRKPFAMAGLYTCGPTGFDSAEKYPVNFAILTTKANEAVAHIHNRILVILPLGRKKPVAAAQPDRHDHVPPDCGGAPP
jgi:putative SOS response-associated peptidase YedK